MITSAAKRAAAGELWCLSATELAQAIRSRRVSSREVIQAHLRRIEAVNPLINAVTVVLGEQALEAANEADRAVAGGGDLPALHGVPFTVKEDLDLAGTPTTFGAKALEGSYLAVDAPVVARLRAAGAIPVGRTNMATFGMGWHTDSELRGATVNPWDRSRTPGGSSGGDAAALAAGLSPLSLGNDTGGSLRWPAQCCGISTLKPTLGRIPRASSIEPADAPISTQLMGVDGPLARRVADLRAAFEVMAGPSWRDPWTVPAPLRGPEPARPIRVALVIDPAGQGTAEQVQQGVRKAASALDDAGYAVDELEPPSIAEAAKTALDMLNPDWHLWWQFMSASMAADVRRFMPVLFEAVGEPDPMTTVQSFMIRQSLLRAWGQFQQMRPLIVAPVCTGIPFTVGTDLTPAGLAETLRGLRMALAVNALGLPAVALPVGIGGGLPQAVQVIGPRYREDLGLDAAAAVEDRLGILTPIDPQMGGMGR
jgi:amidase